MATPDGPWSRLPPPAKPAASARRRLNIGLWLSGIGLVCLLLFVLSRFFPGHLSKPEDQADALRGVLLVALVSTGLLTRVKLTHALRYLALWAVVIVVLLLGYSFRGEAVELATRLRSELIPGYPVATAPGELMITRDTDGGFYLVGQVNGLPVRFLADTGASEIVLSPADAQRLGIDPGSLTYGMPVETANGKSFGAAYTASTLQVGQISLTDVLMSVNKAPMSVSLLGMAFFNRLQSFRIEGNRLYLKPKG